MFVALKHRFLAIIATVLIGAIAIALIRGDIAIDQAAIRALVIVVVVAIVDRYVMPFVTLALGAPKERQPTTSAPAPSPTSTDT